MVWILVLICTKNGNYQYVYWSTEKYNDVGYHCRQQIYWLALNSFHEKRKWIICGRSNTYTQNSKSWKMYPEKSYHSYLLYEEFHIKGNRRLRSPALVLNSFQKGTHKKCSEQKHIIEHYSNVDQNFSCTNLTLSNEYLFDTF